jgi:hypothetical protein
VRCQGERRMWPDLRRLYHRLPGFSPGGYPWQPPPGCCYCGSPDVSHPVLRVCLACDESRIRNGTSDEGVPRR